MKYWTENELRTEIEKRLNQNVPGETWSKCKPDWDPPYSNSDVKDVLGKLTKYNIHSKPRRSKILDSAKLRSELIPEEIEIITYEIRERLFGSKEPPFSNLEEMRNWIDSEVKKQPQPKGFAPEYGYRFDKQEISTEELVELQEEFEQKPGEYGLKFRSLAVPGDTSVKYIVVSEGTPLDHLWWATRSIYQKLGCHKVEATLYVLLGIPPLILPIFGNVIYRAMDLGERSRPEIILTIREPVPDNYIIDYYHKLRRQVWGRKRGLKPFTAKDIELVRFFHNRLDPENPEWDEHRKVWNNRKSINNPDWIFNDWRTFRESYLRAFERVYPKAPPWGFDL